MKLFWKVVTVGLIGAGIAAIRRDAKLNKEAAEEEERRKNTPCDFVDGISQTDFDQMALSSCKHIKRLTDVYTDGPIVYGTVRSQSGISSWSFKIDFNDYGHITGQYWIASDNNDSDIPSAIAKRISSSIELFSEGI